MKTNIKLMDIKGFKTPNYAEPKGDLYRKAMLEIQNKVAEKTRIRNNSTAILKKYNDELDSIKYKIVMAEDEFEETELMKRRKQIREEMEGIEDYSDFDVNAYAKKLIDNPRIKKMKEDAQKEYTAIVQEASLYVKKLEQEYERSQKLWNHFTAGYGSESSFRQAEVQYNRYQNQ